MSDPTDGAPPPSPPPPPPPRPKKPQVALNAPPVTVHALEYMPMDAQAREALERGRDGLLSPEENARVQDLLRLLSELPYGTQARALAVVGKDVTRTGAAVHRILTAPLDRNELADWCVLIGAFSERLERLEHLADDEPLWRRSGTRQSVLTLLSRLVQHQPPLADGAALALDYLNRRFSPTPAEDHELPLGAVLLVLEEALLRYAPAKHLNVLLDLIGPGHRARLSAELEVAVAAPLPGPATVRAWIGPALKGAEQAKAPLALLQALFGHAYVTWSPTPAVGLDFLKRVLTAEVPAPVFLRFSSGEVMLTGAGSSETVRAYNPVGGLSQTLGLPEFEKQVAELWAPEALVHHHQQGKALPALHPSDDRELRWFLEAPREDR